MASIIKADNIQKVSDGSNIIKKCGSTTTIGSGACSPIVICGSTVTLGRCGGTVTLACGATQSGFGQTYSAVAYCTTAKTSPFTAAAGTGYFINTTCGAVTVTLPASPTVGDVVAFKDYAGQWNTNSVTLCNNGNKINGVCATASLNTQNQSVSLIYVDATKGWQDIQDSSAAVTGVSYITATGGTISYCGSYKIHTFTADGCFAVSGLSNNPVNNTVAYMVVAGGGAASPNIAAGGGAGGFREGTTAPVVPYTASPLAATAGITVTATSYPITVGAGGASAPSYPATSPNGSNSVFSTITSAGGGKGGCASCGGPVGAGAPGGSGGGAGGNTAGPVGTGNTPPTSPPQGNPGGSAATGFPAIGAGGGGGATAAGNNGTPTAGGNGGAGATTLISGLPTAYAGGGGGQAYSGTQGTGGIGGGGPAGPGSPCRDGTANTGGGGGSSAGSGGSGIVILRYKYQ